MESIRLEVKGIIFIDSLDKCGVIGLAVPVQEFPVWCPGRQKSLGGNWENRIPKGERGKFCKKLFLPFGRQTVAKKRNTYLVS